MGRYDVYIIGTDYTIFKDNQVSAQFLIEISRNKIVQDNDFLNKIANEIEDIGEVDGVINYTNSYIVSTSAVINFRTKKGANKKSLQPLVN